MQRSVIMVFRNIKMKEWAQKYKQQISLTVQSILWVEILGKKISQKCGSLCGRFSQKIFNSRDLLAVPPRFNPSNEQKHGQNFLACLRNPRCSGTANGTLLGKLCKRRLAAPFGWVSGVQLDLRQMRCAVDCWVPPSYHQGTPLAAGASKLMLPVHPGWRC